MRESETSMVRYAIAAAAIVAGLYTADEISLRYGIPKSRPVYGQVKVERLYAVTLKSRKTSYMKAEPAMETCVESPVPHFGYPPCWYLRRHTRQQINM
jgi:hypothetical protein